MSDKATEYAAKRLEAMELILDSGDMGQAAMGQAAAELVELEIQAAFRAGQAETARNILDPDRNREQQGGGI